MAVRWPWALGVVAGLVAVVGLAADSRVGAGEAKNAPSAEAIAQMMAKEPLSRATWPAWRGRFLEWMYDRSPRTEKFRDDLEGFVRKQADDNKGSLPDYLARDAAAWYLYGGSFLGDKKAEDQAENFSRAETAYRRSIELDAKFAPPHGALSSTLIAQAMEATRRDPSADPAALLAQAEKEAETYASMDPHARPSFLNGMLAFARKDLPKAEESFRQAMSDYPEWKTPAFWYANTVISQPQRSGKYFDATAPLAKRFPEEGPLQVLHALALARDNDFQAAAEHLRRARELKANPEEVTSPALVKMIEHLAQIMTPTFRKGLEEAEAKRFAAAEQLFRQALEEKKDSGEVAVALAEAMLSQDGRDRGKTATEVADLCTRFPQEGRLQALYAAALAQTNRFGAAVAALDKAQQLGVDPAEEIGANNVAKIRQLNEPGLVRRFLWMMACFAGAYAVVMLVMAGVGVLLGLMTRGRPPTETAPAGPHDLYPAESSLKKLYLLVLMISLVLFYVAVPFVILGLIGATGAILYGIFMLGRIPVKLVALIAIGGLLMVWAVLKSVFAKPSTWSFGIRKSEADCPRFHALVREVAEKVDTRGVDEVYLGPASDISVRQEGRGPFGIFGVKRRILTVGMANLRYLTLGELKSILAHEYAHFSHRDTFYSRFIHQVTLSIDTALTGMGAAAGKLNYINPFFWFFVLYYRAYSVLAAGFSRSQEYLADRVAAGLFGRDVFMSALTKVATNGALFEMTVYQNVQRMMAEGKAFINVYEAFASYRDEQLSDEERQKLYQDMLDQKASVFASHPSVRERMQAVAAFPTAMSREETTSLSLFDNVDELEKELTEYLTGFLYAVHSAPAQAEGQEGG